MKNTGYIDKNGEEIIEGDFLRGKSIDGEIKDFKVRLSDYRNNWIGDNPDEIYDIAASKFSEFEIVKEAL